MSEQFTPGPWFAVPTTVRWFGARDPIFDDGLWHIHEESDPEKCEIASIDRGDDHDPPTRKQAEANAHLIAAAPELYRELANAVVLLRAAGVQETANGTIRAAEAALAKARGSQ